MKFCKMCQIEIEQVFIESHNKGMRWRAPYTDTLYFDFCRNQFQDHNGKVMRCIEVFAQALNAHMDKYYGQNSVYRKTLNDHVSGFIKDLPQN